jgi:hypothetical protein
MDRGVDDGEPHLAEVRSPSIEILINNSASMIVINSVNPRGPHSGSWYAWPAPTSALVRERRASRLHACTGCRVLE